MGVTLVGYFSGKEAGLSGVKRTNTKDPLRDIRIKFSRIGVEDAEGLVNHLKSILRMRNVSVEVGLAGMHSTSCSLC